MSACKGALQIATRPAAVSHHCGGFFFYFRRILRHTAVTFPIGLSVPQKLASWNPRVVQHLHCNIGYFLVSHRQQVTQRRLTLGNILGYYVRKTPYSLYQLVYEAVRNMLCIIWGWVATRLYEVR